MHGCFEKDNIMDQAETAITCGGKKMMPGMK